MGVRNVAVIPNAVARVEDGLVSGEPNILFLGAYSYPPNAVAAEYLIHEVWPRIASRCPKARLLIAGLDSDALTSFHHPPPGVEFLGFVSDLGALYRRTRVVCCPIQSGSGTRFKILEAKRNGASAPGKAVRDPGRGRVTRWPPPRSHGLRARTRFEAQGGRIWATRNEDHGLTMHVELRA
jgi:glycosyltransferase involved in cell wall biosynthesis